ncbi:HTTM domain-containing protein [Aestuariibius sp. HNIBRBA575]|uniref:HTTM domain-containing protein n=1 Tax=Aestuariibius sp. HNIBRBA575 TaxID=3233343 RepID=UPI0034A2BC02
MSFELALRATEIMLALAMLQQSLEHFVGPKSEKLLFGVRSVLCVLLIIGWQNGSILWVILMLALISLHRFQGPYNGGSDRMTFLILFCIACVHAAPSQPLKELVFAYLAVQLALSYFVSGYIKIINPEWRSGTALCDVFRFSAYPVSENLRKWADRPRTLFWMSWGVMGFEVVFPLTLLHPMSLMMGLFVAACFHFSNACFFGLNRFFWAWLCAYPSILWFQDRVFGPDFLHHIL